jgi:hypothetical protein
MVHDIPELCAKRATPVPIQHLKFVRAEHNGVKAVVINWTSQCDHIATGRACQAQAKNRLSENVKKYNALRYVLT